MVPKTMDSLTKVEQQETVLAVEDKKTGQSQEKENENPTNANSATGKVDGTRSRASEFSSDAQVTDGPRCSQQGACIPAPSLGDASVKVNQPSVMCAPPSYGETKRQ